MTAGILSVLVGVQITDSNLTSSTAAEPGTGETAWVAATSYAVNDVVYRATTHRRYQNLVAGVNAGLPEDTPLRWYDIGATNRWAMLDADSSTQTATASPATVVLTPGHFNAVYLDGLDADTLAVVVKDAPGGSVISSTSITLEGSAPSDYYEYFFDPFKPQKSALISGIDPYNAAELTVTLTDTSGTVKCGALTMGDLRPLGATLSGATAKPKSYSRVSVDDNGDNVIKRGKKAKDMSATALVDIDEADSVLDSITDLLDIPCLWICTDSANYEGLRVYGLGSAELSFANSTKSLLTLNVIGLI